ncbi:hypothetical protein [Streptomyces niveus]|uniref:aromatic-ring hydroxylase C-terminal domain-containing protein n=1 Tax=Streptomyces niveus TaxID=193462 RepID=UPI003F4D7801
MAGGGGSGDRRPGRPWFGARECAPRWTTVAHRARASAFSAYPCPHEFRRRPSNRYDLGDPHPLVGRGAPDFRLADGTRLGELMRDGRGVLLDLDRSLGGPGRAWESRIRHVAGPARDDLGLGAVLVRPDGTVAWAADRAPAHTATREGFERAADRWFGGPEQTQQTQPTRDAGAHS